MDRCPVCNASYKGEGACRRCKTDLMPLKRIQQEAAEHLAQAVAARAIDDISAMRKHAGRAVSLNASPKALTYLMEAAILTGECSLAATCMKRLATLTH